MKVRTVLLVALLLSSVAAVYLVFVASGLPTSQKTTNDLVTYDGWTGFTYRATVQPTVLYNQTTLLPGQGTLFGPILRTMNLSYTFDLNLSTPTAVSLDVGESLTVSTATWNLTLNHSHRGLSSPQTVTSIAVHDSLVMNFSAVVRTLGQVTNATGFAPGTYVFHYNAVILATLAASGRSGGFLMEPSLNLTYASGYLAPGNFTTQHSGALSTSGTATDTTETFYQELAFGIAVGVFGATAVVAYLTIRPSALARPARSEDEQIEEMTAPYKDAMSMTLSLPHKENIVVMRTWEDLVHAADMLSKPILHLTNRVEGRMRHIFYVVDGAVQYVYVHGVIRQPEAEGAPAQEGVPASGGAPGPSPTPAARPSEAENVAPPSEKPSG